jgi:hypothetical protein
MKAKDWELVAVLLVVLGFIGLIIKVATSI